MCVWLRVSLFYIAVYWCDWRICVSVCANYIITISGGIYYPLAAKRALAVPKSTTSAAEPHRRAEFAARRKSKKMCLCGHQPLQYQIIPRNTHTHERAYVGQDARAKRYDYCGGCVIAVRRAVRGRGAKTQIRRIPAHSRHSAFARGRAAEDSPWVGGSVFLVCDSPAVSSDGICADRFWSSICIICFGRVELAIR